MIIPTVEQPILSIDPKWHRIRIHRQTLRLLGNPAYIQFLVNPNTKMIAIKPGIQQDRLAHRVKYYNSPDHMCYELHSAYLIRSLQRISHNLSNDKVYRIYGVFNTKDSVAQFPMDHLVVIQEDESSVA
jgi:hypothetical protein